MFNKDRQQRADVMSHGQFAVKKFVQATIMRNIKIIYDFYF